MIKTHSDTTEEEEEALFHNRQMHEPPRPPPSTRTTGEFQEKSPDKILDEFGSDVGTSDDDEGLAKMEVEPRRRFETNFLFYVIDMTIQSCVNVSLLWRLPAIAFAVSIMWHDNEIGLLNFIVPWAICMLLIGWPMYMGELGMGQLTRGSTPKVFGSLSIRSRFAGCGWIFGMFSAGALSAFAAFAFAMMCESPQRNGLYFGAAGAGRRCMKLNGWVPEIQPRMCLSTPQALDQSCYSTDGQCSLWDSNGRCVAVPWGPASTEILDSASTIMPWFLNDFPIYCGARHVHNVVTNNAFAVVTRDAFWNDYGEYFHWRLPVGFAVAWVAAGVLAFAKGSIGMFVRFGLASFVVAVLLMLLVTTITWFSWNPWSHSSWVLPMLTLNWKSLFRLEVWVNAVAQSCFAMGIGQNLIPPYAARSPSERNNIVITSTIVTITNFSFGILVLWVFLLAYGALSSWNFPVSGMQPVYPAIAFDVRNSAMANLFTVFETLFDNIYGERQFNGYDQTTYFWGIVWWLGMYFAGIMTLSRIIDQATDACFNSELNFRLLVPRWAWLLIFVLLGFASTIYMWWGVGWATFVTFQHFLINLALPLMVLYQAGAIGWVYGWKVRCKQFGQRANIVQAVLFWVGLIGLTAVLGFLWDDDRWWPQVIGASIAVFLMILSIIIPPFITRDHDSYGKLNTNQIKWGNSLLGPIEHLRTELNYRTCHANAFWRVPKFWSYFIKYTVPIFCALPIFAFGTRAESWFAFSPYRPFFNDQRDIWSRMELMFDLKQLAMPIVWLAVYGTIAFFCVLFPLICFAWPEVLAAGIPKDTDDTFWNVRNAGEVFASAVGASQVPVRVRSPQIGQQTVGTQDAYGQVPKGMEPSLFLSQTPRSKQPHSNRSIIPADRASSFDPSRPTPGSKKNRPYDDDSSSTSSSATDSSFS